MKNFCLPVMLRFVPWLVFLPFCSAGVDSVVTFNEVHYNPALQQTAGEWIELKNQNSVNVDLSGWRLVGGVDYVFPAGTVIPAGGYVVVAANPGALMAAAGIAGVLGPFANSLDNDGETVTLKNNNGRRMDEIAYNDAQPWPMAADGSGATLAKIDELHDSGTPENWRGSVESGGTPGVYNFTAPNNGGGTTPGAAGAGTLKRYYRFEGNANDTSGSNIHGTLAGAPVFAALFPPIVGSGQCLDLNGSNQYVNVPDAFHPSAYTISAWVRPDTIRGQSIIVRSDNSGPATTWSHQLRMTSTGRFEHYFFDGAAKAVTGVTVAAANTWCHVAAVATNSGVARLFVNGVEEGTPQSVGSLWTGGTRWLVGSNSGNGLPGGAAISFFDGKIDEISVWHGPMDASQVGHVATGFKLPTDPVVNNLALGAAVIAGSAAYPNLPFNGGTPPNDFSALNVTDGSAGDLFGYSYWLGRDGVSNEHFVLDLGGPVEISQVLLRNTHNTQFNDRGTANFRLFAAAAVDGSNQPVSPVEILTGTLTTRTGEAPIPADSFTSANGLAPATARYLKFETLSSSYPGGHVGLNEIEVFGTRVTGPVGPGRPPVLPLVINEVTNDDEPFWVELYNYGADPLTLTGFVLETNQGASYTLPATTLSAGAFLVLDAATTGLQPLDEDKLFLYGAGKTTVVDAVVVKAQRHRQRRAPLPGAAPGEFLSSDNGAHATPGAANVLPLETGVVINEIMYHRRPQFLPYVENPEEWIELYNKSAVPVDLGGWRLDEAVSFTFPPGTVLAPGAYLCVTNDALAFTAAHPGVPVIGNFSGGLSNRGERIRLEDALGNAVDVVFYRDKEPWPIYTDGLGSSLELRNPEADNSVPESWAASDESTRSAWQNYTFTAIAQTPIYTPTITTTGTTAFHELRMGLLEEGEVLVDDVSVREITTAPGVELMQNGTFSTALTPVWRVLGNHDQSAIVSDAGNPVLALRASGPLLYMHNLLETSLKNAGALVPVVNGRQYTISLRAKWLRGCPWLHTEFYYNKVAKTFLLDLPSQSGTPGAQNSTFVANTGPSFTEVIHAPVVPAAGEAVTVTARVRDPQGVGPVTLRYAVNGGAFNSVPMTAGAGGLHSAVIPGQAASAVTQFYLEAADAALPPVTAQWPAAGPASRALIRVNEGAAVAAKQNLRVITTAADAAELASQVNMMSNRRRGCTIIHNEREVFYDGKIRLRGSMYSRSNTAQAGESITFPSDRLFRGTQRTVSVRRSGMAEIVVKHAINRAAGLPDNYNDVIQLISFRSDIVGPARMEMERFNNSWLDEFYPEGSDGTQFKLEGIRVPTLTFANGTIPAGNPEGIKNLTTSGMNWVVNLDLADLGPDGEQYRHGFRWLNNFSRNENGRFVQLCRTLSMPVGTAAEQQAFEAAIEPLMDVDEWMRVFAMMSLFGIGDVYSQPPGTVATVSNPHNLNFYMPPTPDGKISAIPWDWNFVFSLASNAPLTGDKNIQKVIARPRFKRLFLGHLKDLMAASFNTAYMNPWLTHYGSVTGESYAGYAANIANRSSSVNSQILAQIPAVTFSITTNGGADFSTGGANTVLEGDGWVDVHEIRLNGSPESLAVTWLDENSWRVTVPLAAGVNALTLGAFNRQGGAVGSDTITITNTSAIVPASAANTVISEIHYNPTAGGTEFVEVMNISAAHSVDFTGCAFTAGIDYVFPPATIVPAGGRLVITAAQFLNDTALSNGGERLTLEAPGGVIIRSFTYDDDPPWPLTPDGLGPSLVLIAPQTNPDHAVAANWRASTADGGNAGTSDALPFTGDAGADTDGDGWSDLVEYALGADPQITHTLTPQGLTFTIPRVPNADDALISGEVSTALSGWTAAELIAATPVSLTYRVPAALSADRRIFLRALVTLR